MALRDFYNSGTYPVVARVYRSTTGPNGPWLLWMGPFNRTSFSGMGYRMVGAPTSKVGDIYVYSTEYGCLRTTCSTPGYTIVAKGKYANEYFKEVAEASSVYAAFAASPVDHGLQNPNPKVPKVPTAVVNAAIGRANAKLLNYPSWNVGQSLGEARETSKFLLNSALTLGSALKALRGGNRKVLSRMFPPDRIKANKRRYERWLNSPTRDKTLYQVSGSPSWTSPLAAPSSLYLGYQYGVLPLMSDLYNAADTLANGLIPNGTMHFTQKTPDPSLGPCPPTAGWTVEWDGDIRREVTIGYMAKVSNPTLYGLTQYGLTDPLSLAWDLVPLSFVVDWFTNLGSFIDSLSQPIGCRLVDGFITRYQHMRGTYTYYLNGTQKVSGSYPSFTIRQECFKRNKLLTLPVSEPHFKMGLDTSKLTSLGALMVSLGK